MLLLTLFQWRFLPPLMELISLDADFFSVVARRHHQHPFIPQNCSQLQLFLASQYCESRGNVRRFSFSFAKGHKECGWELGGGAQQALVSNSNVNWHISTPLNLHKMYYNSPCLLHLQRKPIIYSNITSGRAYVLIDLSFGSRVPFLFSQSAQQNVQSHMACIVLQLYISCTSTLHLKKKGFTHCLGSQKGLHLFHPQGRACLHHSKVESGKGNRPDLQGGCSP